MSHRTPPALLLWLLPVFAALGQSNLLVNPSFEDPGLNPLTYKCILNDLPVWDFASNGANRCPASAPHGNVTVSFLPYLAQDVTTVPNRRYYFKLASQGPVSVSFGDQLVTTLTNIGGTNVIFNQPWAYSYCHLLATGSVTRLSLLSSDWVYVDDLLLGWLDEPIRLIQPPLDTEVPLGGRATLQVAAQGGPPLHYQWFKDSAPIEGARKSVYFITNGTTDMAGAYHVVVSNHVGSVTSSPARLTVSTLASAPQLTFQPENVFELVSSIATLRSGAIGRPPLHFQWRMNGTNLPGKTNTVLEFLPLVLGDTGVYDVVVENSHGTTVSLPATVTVTDTARWGSLGFRGNTFPAYRRPCFDIDGVTPLVGSEFLCQVYAGENPESVVARGVSHRFRTNSTLAGVPESGVHGFSLRFPFPDSSANWTVYYQLRAWEAAFGSSYEEARSLGGKIGTSALLSTTLSDGPTEVILPGLTLRAGLPGFTTGRISKGERDRGPLIEWQLIGAPGFTYLIERRQPPNNWFPFLILSNSAGTVPFVDPDQQNRSQSFYRGRILD